jgi:hypothetical protein
VQLQESTRGIAIIFFFDRISVDTLTAAGFNLTAWHYAAAIGWFGHRIYTMDSPQERTGKKKRSGSSPNMARTEKRGIGRTGHHVHVQGNPQEKM